MDDYRNLVSTNWDIYGSLYKISPAKAITVTFPNGNETWVVSSEHNITWTSTNFADPVSIAASYAGYGTQLGQVLTPSTLSDGSFPWTLLNNPSANCGIRIQDVADGDPSDMSDTPFAIVVPYGANTFPGANVQIHLGSGVTRTFDNVTAADTASLTTPQNGSPPSGGFTIIPSGSPIYYSITTIAAFTGNIKVCIQYGDAGL